MVRWALDPHLLDHEGDEENHDDPDQRHRHGVGQTSQMVPPDISGLMSAAASLIGAIEFVTDRSWPHGVSIVLEVRGADGTPLIVKQPHAVEKFDAELHAYRHWAPALAPHVPEVVAADRDTRVLVFSKLPGEIGDLSESTFREAGRLLRMLHTAQTPKAVDGFAAASRDRFDTWVQRARPGLLADAEVEFVADQMRRLSEFPDPLGVPCHRDWQPRNWLTAEDGSVAVIDFGNSRVGHWFQDFERIWWTEWRTEPALGHAFFEGYGRTLSDDDRVQLRATSNLWLLTTIVWADEVDDVTFGDHARSQLRQALAGAPDPI